MNRDDLISEILNLIESKREDDWWDFKREHHHDKAELVHDILCMANNRPRKDSYIIFGVDNETFSVVGVESDTYRRNQQGITDILRNITFAGSVRPRIEIQTITLGNHEIDVLIIKDSLDVPYYLEKEYQDKNVKNAADKKYRKIVKPYHIYTRVVDNNTAIDKQADMNDVEFLWRKRFGIELPIMERLHILLSETDKWIFDWGNKKYCYHIEYPEFQMIQVDDVEQYWHPSAAFYTHPVMHFARLNITYHSTVIYETELWVFDQFRKYLPKAEIYSIEQQANFCYTYYMLDSIEGKLLQIFTHRNCDISSREHNYHQLLIFENDEEKQEFDAYLSNHFNDHSDDEVTAKYQYQIQEDNHTNLGGLNYSAFQVAKIAWLYEDWQQQK
mgnify:CR=1 FL=1